MRILQKTHREEELEKALADAYQILSTHDHRCKTCVGDQLNEVTHHITRLIPKNQLQKLRSITNKEPHASYKD